MTRDKLQQSTDKPVAAGHGQRKWTSERHRWVVRLFKQPLRLYLWLALGYRSVKFRDENPRQPYLILANHDGPFDAIMMGMSFRQPIYYVASDHVFRLGWVSRLIRFLVAPIPIVKSIIDTRSIRDILNVFREGGSVGLFPSGNRSFTGSEMPIPPSTAKLVKHVKVPVLLFRYDSGYLATPRWSRHNRRGKVTGRVVRVLGTEELAAMSLEEIHRILQDTLQDVPPSSREPRLRFRGRRLAEHLELVLFVCPRCLRLNTLRSKEDLLSCDCGYAVRYTEEGRLEDTSPGNALLSLPDVEAFDVFQRGHLKKLLGNPDRLAQWRNTPFFTDECQLLTRVKHEHKWQKNFFSTMRLYSDRLEFEDANGIHAFPFSRMGEINIHGPQTLQFHDREDNAVYEVRSPHPRSAYRYMLIIETIRAAAPQPAA